jgi:hypothetical protein
MKLSRPWLLVATVALSTSLGVLSPPPPAQAIIPVPLLIEVAFPIIKELSQHVDKTGSVDWKTETSKQLDEVIGLSVGITNELKEMNVVIKKDTTAAFSDFVEKKLKADISQFEDHLPELRGYPEQSSDVHQRMNYLIIQLENDIDTSLGYGAAVYETTYTAIIVQRALFKFLDVNHESQKRFFTRVASNFDDWLDPSKEGSPAALRANEENQIEANKKEVSNIRDKYKGYFEISGDLDKGFESKKISKIRWAGDPQDELKRVISEYKRHVSTRSHLDEILFQLRLYHDSLSEVAKGGRLALRGTRARAQ